MRVGIYGGTFNPPHNGHKKLAYEFTGRLSLDLLIIVPDKIPPHKQSDFLASGEDRLNMCRLCFNNPDTIVSDIELKRDSESYTVITLSELKKMYPDDDLYFLMGSDMLLSFHQWKEPEKILDYAVICAADRNDGKTECLYEYINNYFPDRKDRFVIMNFTPIDISSTDIRKNIGNYSDVLPESVSRYIAERGIYI